MRTPQVGSKCADRTGE